MDIFRFFIFLAPLLFNFSSWASEIKGRYDLEDLDELITFTESLPLTNPIDQLSSNCEQKTYSKWCKSELYKTELCKQLEENGSCSYGKKCQFAHGQNELRYKLVHPKYRTVPCRNLAKDGYCPYGNRCVFLH
jgi:Zinc finger C-x8-C-x5-C-x3-H type (and similar)